VDERGFFARTYCVREFQEHGLVSTFVQRNISYNRTRGPLRGMHFQLAPHAETKVVSCSRGAIHDVIIDLRPSSPSYRRHIAVALTADSFEALYVPEGCAHGFLTLTDDAVVEYQMSTFHHPGSAGGVRYDDPAFGITWPMAPAVISERDRTYPDFSATASG